MLAPVAVAVASVGEDVSLTVDGWHRRLHFETAVMLAAWLDECAREAKAHERVTSKLLIGHGTLHDASDHRWLDAGQPNDPRHVQRVDRNLLKLASIDVQAHGALVGFSAGSASMMLPWAAAIQIAQWIRLRAKESQMRAGDLTRHWSGIVREHEAAHG